MSLGMSLGEIIVITIFAATAGISLGLHHYDLALYTSLMTIGVIVDAAIVTLKDSQS